MRREAATRCYAGNALTKGALAVRACVCGSAENPLRVTRLRGETIAIRQIVTWKGKTKIWVLPLLEWMFPRGQHISKSRTRPRPANTHINLFCSLRRQSIPQNDFIISSCFTGSPNRSPLSGIHSVLLQRLQQLTLLHAHTPARAQLHAPNSAHPEAPPLPLQILIRRFAALPRLCHRFKVLCTSVSSGQNKTISC